MVFGISGLLGSSCTIHLLGNNFSVYKPNIECSQDGASVFSLKYISEFIDWVGIDQTWPLNIFFLLTSFLTYNVCHQGPIKMNIYQIYYVVRQRMKRGELSPFINALDYFLYPFKFFNLKGLRSCCMHSVAINWLLINHRLISRAIHRYKIQRSIKSC